MPRQSSVPSSLRIHLLGRCRIEVDGEPVEVRRKAKRLINLLALQPQHQLHREQIIDFLWCHQEQTAALNNLHKTIHAARRALEPRLTSGGDSRFILTRNQQVILSAPGELWVDVEAFEKGAEENLRRADSIAACEDALALYGGELLADDPYEEWAAERREELRLAYQSLLWRVARFYEEGGQRSRAITLYKELLAADSLNEDAHRRLMLVYAEAGERRQALQQFDQCRAVLNRELNVEPDAATHELYRRIVAEQIASPTPVGNKIEPQPNESLQPTETLQPKETSQPRETRTATNLPHPVKSFVGRVRDIAEVKRLLGGARLLTLAGTGGIGKTSLATKVAAELLDDFRDGVWMVELASLNSPALVPHAVAATLGVREQAERPLAETLRAFLQTKSLLLVLDNCEHLVEAAATFADALLPACPNLRILATSREALGVEGETVWRVSPLSLPEADPVIDPTRAAEYEAVQLFVERVLLGNPDWTLTAANAPLVAQLCRRLDGIPLAIELAAARVKVLTPQQILAKMDERFHLLTDGGRSRAPRHKTLRALIDWSYELLSVEEQAAWRRLSAFAGGWTLEAAEFVCVDERIEAGEVLDLLAHLVDKSIVVVEQHGAGARYRFLETIRQYGAERLRQSREESRVRALQFQWLFQLADSADHEFSGPHQRTWYERLETEHDNFRSALQWCLRTPCDADGGLRLCSALWRFWQAHGHLTEGRKWFDAFLSHACAASESVHANALHGASGLASMQGDFELARAFLEQSLALRRKIDDKHAVAHTLQRLGIIAYYTGDYERATMLQQESLILCQEMDDQHGVARAVNGLGILALDQGRYEQARTRFEQCLAIYRREGHRLGIMATLNNLGETSQRQGDYDAAERLLQESLSMAHELSDTGWIARSIHVLGNVAAGQGRYESATELFKKALAMFREVGDASAIYVLEGMACTAAGRGEAARSLCLAEAASSLRETFKMKRTPADQSALNKYLRAAKRALSVEETRRALASGRAMTLERAIDFALRHE